MLFIIMLVIISLSVIGVIYGTHPTNHVTETRTTDLASFTIPSFDEWCAQHTEQEAVEKPSLFFPVPELTNSLQHIGIPSFEDWCSAHPEQEQPGVPMFAPLPELTNSLTGMDGITFDQWCDEHPVVEVHAAASKVCALEVHADKVIEAAPVTWVETDRSFSVLRDVLTKYTEDPTEQEQITWDIFCAISGAIPEAVAEAVMADMAVGEILAAAADKNASAFRKVNGVGPKRADLIISCLYEFYMEHSLSL